MEDFFEESELNSKDKGDEIILDEISRQVFCGDIEHNDYSPRICLTSLGYFLLQNFEIKSFKELNELEMKVRGRVIDLSGGSDLSDFECDKPKGMFLNRLRTPFRS